VIHVNNFLNIPNFLIVCSENLHIFVQVEDGYCRTLIPRIKKAHENLVVFFAPVQTL